LQDNKAVEMSCDPHILPTAFGKLEGVKVSGISVFLGPGIHNIHGHYFI